MTNSIINWFQIDNWFELNFSYRLVDVIVEGIANDNKISNKSFFTAMTHLAQVTKGPTAFTYHNGRRYVAVKADANIEIETIPGNPVNIKLVPTSEIFHLTGKEIRDENRDLIIRFLDSQISWQLGKNVSLWDAGNNTFLRKTPLSLSSDIDIYQGFKFKLVSGDEKGIFVCIDLAYRYAYKRNIHELLKQFPKEKQANLISNRNLLYQNGDDWYTVKGRAITNSITTHKISHQNDEVTVYDYILNNGKYSKSKNKAPLLKESATLIYSYVGQTEKTFAGATCLSKLIARPEDGLHRNSINEPNKRFDQIERDIASFFSRLYYENKHIRIAKKPYNTQGKLFRMPALKYGRNAVLNPYDNPLNYGDAIDTFPKRRRDYLYKNGIYTQTPFSNQYLFVPDNMDASFGKALKSYFDETMKRIAPKFNGFIIHKYSVKEMPFAHKVYSHLNRYIDQNNLAGGFGLFVLPEDIGDNGDFLKSLHNIVKKELFDKVKMKCVTADRLLRYLKMGANKDNPLVYSVPDSEVRNFRSYQAYTLFEFLVLNKKWPFALANKLNHDLYIGIDAHEFYAGFCFFFGNGEKIVFDVKKVSKGTGTYRNEKLNHSVISDKIYEVLGRHLRVTDEKPKSIIILRDGVSYGEEEKALEIAVNKLQSEGLLTSADLKTGVINVAKSSAIPFRAAKILRNGSYSLRNPDCGTCFKVNKDNYFIFNTGKPYQVRGSSKPLQISLVKGDFDFYKSVQDIYCLTQMAFSAPDRATSLPLPLKLIDTLIRDIAHQYDFAFTQDNETRLVNPI